MYKLKITLAAATLAATLTLSCGGGNEDDNPGGGGSGGGTAITETYKLKSITDDKFTYIEEYTDDRCREGGILEIENRTWDNTVNYSIANNILTIGYEYSRDTLNFKGTSNELIGTWTRTRNKAASCELRTYYDGDGYECKEDYDLVKAVFTATTVKITHDYCPTDDITEKPNKNGWKNKVTNCLTYEISKDLDKITVKLIMTDSERGMEVSYKGKSCKRKWTEPSESQRKSACEKAWKEHKDDPYWEDYYDDILYDYSKFEECIKKLLPEELVGGDDGDGENTNSPSKLAAKAKFAPLLKKK